MSTSTTDAGARAPRIPCPWHGWRRTARLGVAVLACTFAGAGQAQNDYSNLDRAVEDLAERLVGRGNLEGKQVLVRPDDFFEMESERSLPLSKHLAWTFSTDLRRYGAKPVSGSADESKAITLQGRWRIESGSGMLLLSVEVKQLAGPGLNERRRLAPIQGRVPVASIDETYLESDLESHGRHVVRQLERRIEMHLPGNRRFRLHIRPFSADGVSDPEKFNRYLLGNWRPAFTNSPVFVTGVGTAQSDGKLHGDIYVTGRRIEAHLVIRDNQTLEVAAATVEMDKGLFPSRVVDPDCVRHVEAGCSAAAVKCYADVLKETPGDTQALAGLEGLAGTKFRDCAECPDLVVVASGSYLMGSPESESGRDDDEGPRHRVTIGRPFAVGVKEVTRGEYGRFVSETGRSTGDSCWEWYGEWKKRSGRHWEAPGFSQTDAHPAVCVSWKDADAYVEWLSGETREGYRLLSESEWEYVARGGTGTSRYWGESEEWQCRYANGGDKALKRHDSDWKWAIASCDDGHARTSPVGRYEANGFGLHDVLGNVREWVEDCWNGSYAGAPRDGSAWESGDCKWRVLRGGSWNYFPRDLRSANRVRDSSGNRSSSVGFRVARTLTP